MKRFLQISGLAFLMMLFTGLKNTASAQPGGQVSYQDFYDELSPYGQWIDYPEYGYVWSPNEGADFRPYSTNGQWVWSDDYEWMWVSDYSWGWAPFHYGRWFYDDMYGWMWMPGYDWSPAWVAWRGGGDYYGWAPLRPGINISVGFSIGSYAPPSNYWCFAPSRYITSPRIYDYCVSSRQNLTIINNTTIINNYNYNRNVFVTGPRRNEVERYTNQRINSVRVREISRPERGGFRNNEVSVYRPGIARENSRSFAPREFNNYRQGGNREVARGNENRNNGRPGFGERVDRSNNNGRFENRNQGRVSGDINRSNVLNGDRSNRGFGDRRANDGQQQGARDQRQFDQRAANSNERRSQNSEAQINRSGNNAENESRQRSARDVFGRDNRAGFDQPVRRNGFERSEPANDNRVRNDNGNFNRREQNNNRFQGSAPARQEQRDFGNRNNVQPQQQQRQSFPQMNQRQQEQPRRFEPTTQNRGNNGDNNRGGGGGGFNRGRRG